MLIFVTRRQCSDEISSYLSLNPDVIMGAELVLNHRWGPEVHEYSVVIHLSQSIRLFGENANDCIKFVCDSLEDAEKLISRVSSVAVDE